MRKSGLHPGRGPQSGSGSCAMSNVSRSLEDQGRRHKLLILSGFAVVVLGLLVLAAVGVCSIPAPLLGVLFFAASKAVFGVVDRMPCWEGEHPTSSDF